MAFDDLARHMASRDGRKKVEGSADQILADAAEADRRMTRTRNLILGALLMVGGAVIVTLCWLYFFDTIDPKPDPGRPPNTGGTVLYPYGLAAVAVGMVFTGLVQIIRGLRGR